MIAETWFLIGCGILALVNVVLFAWTIRFVRRAVSDFFRGIDWLMATHGTNRPRFERMHGRNETRHPYPEEPPGPEWEEALKEDEGLKFTHPVVRLTDEQMALIQEGHTLMGPEDEARARQILDGRLMEDLARRGH